MIVDRTASAHMADFVCGANKEDLAIQGVNWGRDLPEPELVADLCTLSVPATRRRTARHGCPSSGIEVGARLYWARSTPEALKATFLDETGKPAVLQMWLLRHWRDPDVGAAIEQNHDARGIIWPRDRAFRSGIRRVGWAK